MSNGQNRRGRILVVEDQGIVATDIQRCLEDEGFEVTAIATSMKDAVREASACRPDLVLMDIRIQGEADGIEAADYLRRHFNLPVIYLTAHDDPDTMARANRTEPMAFLVKPFKPAELTSTVEIALKRAEQGVRERERFFLSAMDSIGDAVLTAEWRVGDLPFADCDPTLTRQVFANLLANAVKFSRPRKPAVIEVGQALSAGQTLLFVRDNGVGFSMKYADKLFGVFQRLHRREDFEGTGVGLVTVQRIIHKHGGRIWVEAELDKGATFYFTLDPPVEPSSGSEAQETAVVVGGAVK